MFERRRPHRELAVERQAHGTPAPDVVAFGLGCYGERLARRFGENRLGVLGVEFDPEVVQRLRRQGLAVRFGDAQDADFLEGLPLDGVPWTVSTLPNLESDRALLHALAARGYAGELTVVARDDTQEAALKRARALTVLYLLRDTVDFTVEHLASRIRPEQEAPR